MVSTPETWIASPFGSNHLLQLAQRQCLRPLHAALALDRGVDRCTNPFFLIHEFIFSICMRPGALSTNSTCWGLVELIAMPLRRHRVTSRDWNRPALRVAALSRYSQGISEAASASRPASPRAWFGSWSSISMWLTNESR